MHIEEFKEFIIETLGDEMPNLSIETSEDGQILIFSGLAENADGEVIDFEELENEYDNEEEDNETELSEENE